MKFTVDRIFKDILDREMQILIEEKSKSCQIGAVIDLATQRLMEGYFIKKEYDDMKNSKEFQTNIYRMEKEERERYQKLYENLKLKIKEC